ncbi:MAG: 30S ribosomal protein S2 [Patescibacteria group bacterium]
MEENKTIQAKEKKDGNKESSKEDYFANLDFSNLEISMEAMIKKGVHFGHQKSRRNPKMDEYIFGTRKGINLIDLQKTEEKLKEALEFIKKVKSGGKEILFVGTKKQIKEITRSAAKAAGMPFVVERWLGGTFTNFKIIRARAKYLKDLKDMIDSGEVKKYTKFEQMKMQEELDKLEIKLGGIKDMKELPGAIFVTDIKENELAIKEAKKVGISVIALADTNTDPTIVDYPIPANDDAISSVRLMLGYVCKAILESNLSENREQGAENSK